MKKWHDCVRRRLLREATNDNSEEFLALYRNYLKLLLNHTLMSEWRRESHC